MEADRGPVVSVAVEGLIDEAVALRILDDAGARPGPVYGKQGKERIRRGIRGYNEAARRTPWLVLVDLDREEECAPRLVGNWLPVRAPGLCLRVTVREVEAWLLADRRAMAAFLSVAAELVPRDPESEPDPKRAVTDLAVRSRRREIREGLAPRPGSGRSTGPLYSALLAEFVRSRWRPSDAARVSPSRRRAIACVAGLVEARA